LLQFKEELPSIDLAEKVSLDAVSSEMKELSADFKTTRETIENMLEDLRKQGKLSQPSSCTDPEAKQEDEDGSNSKNENLISATHEKDSEIDQKEQNSTNQLPEERSIKDEDKVSETILVQSISIEQGDLKKPISIEGEKEPHFENNSNNNAGFKKGESSRNKESSQDQKMKIGREAGDENASTGFKASNADDILKGCGTTSKVDKTERKESDINEKFSCDTEKKEGIERSQESANVESEPPSGDEVKGVYEKNAIDESETKQKKKSKKSISDTENNEALHPMEKFVEHADASIKNAVTQIEKAKENYHLALEYFGEDEKMTTADFFGTIQKFIGLFDTTLELVNRLEAIRVRFEQFMLYFLYHKHKN